MGQISNNWKVQINNEGNLYIRAKKKQDQYLTLFGTEELEYGLCIYSHYLRPVRQLLCKLFPDTTIKSLDKIESLIKEEFCDARSLSTFKRFLESAEIPYRAYENAA